MWVCWESLGLYVYFLQYAARKPVSSSLDLCAHMAWQPWATNNLPAFPGEVIAGSHATVTVAVHMAYSHLLSDHPYPLQSQVLLFLSIMACHSLMKTQAKPLCLSENLIS